jgi:hypothetical protein
MQGDGLAVDRMRAARQYANMRELRYVIDGGWAGRDRLRILARVGCRVVQARAQAPS